MALGMDPNFRSFRVWRKSGDQEMEGGREEGGEEGGGRSSIYLSFSFRPGRGMCALLVMSGLFLVILSILGYSFRPLRELDLITNSPAPEKKKKQKTK
jgi:hypothetical protein